MSNQQLSKVSNPNMTKTVEGYTSVLQNDYNERYLYYFNVLLCFSVERLHMFTGFITL